MNLTDIQLAYLTNPDSGYKLTFHFAPNEFFTNQTLTKTYHYEVRQRNRPRVFL